MGVDFTSNLKTESSAERALREKKEEEAKLLNASVETELPPVDETSGETAHEAAGRRAIEAANEAMQADRENNPVIADRKLAEAITEIEVERDAAGVKLVVTRDNEVTIVIPIMLPVEAINSVVNAFIVLKEVVHASREDFHGRLTGMVRR